MRAPAECKMPIILSREVEIVTPGPLTTATRVLKLALGADVRTRDLSFDAVLDEVIPWIAEQMKLGRM